MGSPVFVMRLLITLRDPGHSFTRGSPSLLSGPLRARNRGWKQELRPLEVVDGYATAKEQKDDCQTTSIFLLNYSYRQLRLHGR